MQQTSWFLQHNPSFFPILTAFLCVFPKHTTMTYNRMQDSWMMMFSESSTTNKDFLLTSYNTLTNFPDTNLRTPFRISHIYDPGSRFATTPPPPHGMVPKPAFCSIPHENVVFAVFFAWWVAGAVRNPANSLDFCNQPSKNVLFAMFRLRHRGVVPPRPLLFLCQIII